MDSSPLLGLIPLNDCVLVELEQKHRNVSTSESKYDSRTQGIVVGLPEWLTKNHDKLEPLNLLVAQSIGKRVFWEDFKEGARIPRNGKLYSFIKIEDLRGYENVETS